MAILFSVYNKIGYHVIIFTEIELVMYIYIRTDTHIYQNILYLHRMSMVGWFIRLHRAATNIMLIISSRLKNTFTIHGSSSKITKKK